MYWELIAATGWTYDYVDTHMTLPRVTAIMGAWAASPPAHWSLSALAGFKAKPKAGKAAEQNLSGMFGIQEVKREQ